MKQDNFECLITGAYLLSDMGYAHGDLFRGAGVYIFNAVMDKGETNWDRTPWPDHKVLKVLPQANFWERRGIIIIPAMNAKLNDEAIAYVTKLVGEPKS